VDRSWPQIGPSIGSTSKWMASKSQACANSWCSGPSNSRMPSRPDGRGRRRAAVRPLRNACPARFHDPEEDPARFRPDPPHDLVRRLLVAESSTLDAERATHEPLTYPLLPKDADQRTDRGRVHAFSSSAALTSPINGARWPPTPDTNRAFLSSAPLTSPPTVQQGPDQPSLGHPFLSSAPLTSSRSH
jgi:hypothetical protein